MKQISYCLNKMLFFVLILSLICVGCKKYAIPNANDMTQPTEIIEAKQYSNVMVMNGRLRFNSRKEIEKLKYAIMEEGIDKYIAMYKNSGHCSLYEYSDSVIPQNQLQYFGCKSNLNVDRPFLYSDFASPDTYLNLILNTNMEVQVGDTLFQIIRDTLFMYQDTGKTICINKFHLENNAIKLNTIIPSNQGMSNARVSFGGKYGWNRNLKQINFADGVFSAQHFLTDVYFYKSAGVESWFEKSRRRCTFFGKICWDSWQKTVLEKMEIIFNGTLNINEPYHTVPVSLQSYKKTENNSSGLSHFFHFGAEVGYTFNGSVGGFQQTVSSVLNIPTTYIPNPSYITGVRGSSVSVESLTTTHVVKQGSSQREIVIDWKW